MKKALLVIGVLAVSWVSGANAAVSPNDVRQAAQPNPWKVISHGVQPNPFLSRGVAPNPWKDTGIAPNPWKSFDVRQAVTPNPWKVIGGRAAPNPWKTI